MQWDLGLQGLGLLVVMSLGFGVLAQLIAGKRTTRRLWLIASAAAFVGGLLTSEVWFGWATEEELQPNIDGLSFDEALLGALISAIVAVLVTRYVTRKRSVEPADRAAVSSPGGRSSA
jgi:ABC-type transporter Mla maintaining outer membrane lipid asymmetry permease subunit MlaE